MGEEEMRSPPIKMYFLGAFTEEEIISIYKEVNDGNVRAKIWNTYFRGQCPACKKDIGGGDPYCPKCGFNVRMYAMKHGFSGVYDDPQCDKCGK